MDMQTCSRHTPHKEGVEWSKVYVAPSLSKKKKLLKQEAFIHEKGAVGISVIFGPKLVMGASFPTQS